MNPLGFLLQHQVLLRELTREIVLPTGGIGNLQMLISSLLGGYNILPVPPLQLLKLMLVTFLSTLPLLAMDQPMKNNYQFIARFYLPLTMTISAPNLSPQIYLLHLI